jgi:hypothetical protein
MNAIFCSTLAYVLPLPSHIGKKERERRRKKKNRSKLTPLLAFVFALVQHTMRRKIVVMAQKPRLGTYAAKVA